MRKVILAAAMTTLMTVSVPSMAATQTVIAVGATFVPPAVVASRNDTIRLQNSDVLPHTLTINERLCRDTSGNAIACNTGLINPGANGSFTLVGAPAGSYRFLCQLHPNMTGFIVVAP